LKFVEPTRLAQTARKPSLRLLDICYGLGYNTAAALATIWAINPNCCVEVVGLEINPVVPQAAIAHHLLSYWNPDYTRLLTQLATEHQVHTDRLQATLLIGDARAMIGLLHQSGFQADAIFWTHFHPNCPNCGLLNF
jgi:tRNA U34 5-methylaminomethyl-2-thiouridine-forming methyltransferase MnmC